MYKKILAAVTILSISYASQAAERSEIWSCVDSSTMAVKANCVTKTMDSHTNDAFFQQLAQKRFEPQNDALASITLYPKQNLIVVQSLESTTTTAVKTDKDVLLAANR